MKQFLWLDGKGVGKGRPRARGRIVRRNGKQVVAITMYTDPKYRAWKNKAIAAIKKWDLQAYPANTPVSVACYFVNFFSSDSDNLTGSVLDALKQAKIIYDDSAKYVSESKGIFCKKRKLRNQNKQVGILVEIEPKEIIKIPEHLEIFLNSLL